jgi:hypothetical protein
MEPSKFKTVLFFLLLAPLAFAQPQSDDSFTDSRDKQKYRTVKIGNQTWMAENLNYNASGSKCYNNDESNCKKYGRLYDLSTAKKACPSGWRLPIKAEWDALSNSGGDGYSGGDFLDVGSYGDWWSASEYDSGSAYRRYMDYYDDYAYWVSDDKDYLHSVRCIQD